MIHEKHFIPLRVVIAFVILATLIITGNNKAFALKETKPNETGPWPGLYVNTYTGNFFYQRSDLYIPGRGLSIDITFSYNSGRTIRDWGFGHGWTFTYNLLYEIHGDTIFIERGDGQKDAFIWNGTSYDPPTGIYDMLTEYSPGKYLLTTKYGSKYYFDEATHKKITKIEDRNGNTITFAYTGEHLDIITDASGRQLILSWSNDHLSQITDPNTTPSRTISYEYEEKDGYIHLTKVIDPLDNSIFSIF